MYLIESLGKYLFTPILVLFTCNKWYKDCQNSNFCSIKKHNSPPYFFCYYVLYLTEMNYEIKKLKRISVFERNTQKLSGLAYPQQITKAEQVQLEEQVPKAQQVTATQKVLRGLLHRSAASLKRSVSIKVCVIEA